MEMRHTLAEAFRTLVVPMCTPPLSPSTRKNNNKTLRVQLYPLSTTPSNPNQCLFQTFAVIREHLKTTNKSDGMEEFMG